MYTENGDTITLTLNRADYDFLIFMLGAAAGRASQDRDKTTFWQCLEFTNCLLAGSPRFHPYPIPEHVKADADLPRAGA